MKSTQSGFAIAGVALVMVAILAGSAYIFRNAGTSEDLVAQVSRSVKGKNTGPGGSGGSGTTQPPKKTCADCQKIKNESPASLLKVEKLMGEIEQLCKKNPTALNPNKPSDECVAKMKELKANIKNHKVNDKYNSEQNAILVQICLDKFKGDNPGRSCELMEYDRCGLVQRIKGNIEPLWNKISFLGAYDTTFNILQVYTRPDLENLVKAEQCNAETKDKCLELERDLQAKKLSLENATAAFNACWSANGKANPTLCNKQLDARDSAFALYRNSYLKYYYGCPGGKRYPTASEVISGVTKRK